MRPAPPEWVVERGLQKTNLVAVHTGDCWTVRKSSRCVGVSQAQAQALDALRHQVSACTHCRPDVSLGFWSRSTPAAPTPPNARGGVSAGVNFNPSRSSRIRWSTEPGWGEATRRRPAARLPTLRQQLFARVAEIQACSDCICRLIQSVQVKLALGCRSHPKLMDQGACT
ncbi:DUF6233 domain-containing protein [Streptomyces sp. NPDC004365]